MGKKIEEFKIFFKERKDRASDKNKKNKGAKDD